jgi:hypothetical protein
LQPAIRGIAAPGKLQRLQAYETGVAELKGPESDKTWVSRKDILLEIHTRSIVRTALRSFEQQYSKCLLTSNKAKSNLGCAEEKFQTRGWVLGCET